MIPLSERQIARLSDEDKKTYDLGMSYCRDGWANGPYGGWVRGHKLLESIGYTRIERREGGRVFVRLDPSQYTPDAE